MIDYSGWLNALVPSVEFITAASGVLAIIFLSGVGLAFHSMYREEKGRMGGVESPIGVTLMILAYLAVFIIGGVGQNVPEGGESFRRMTERSFGVERLVCGNADKGDSFPDTSLDQSGCPVSRLPADRTAASWMRDGRLEQGRFIIDGHRVGLAGPDGELLKPVKR